ncbi:hypothetical protein [Myroides sp. C4067]|uniref:hypothetical protein n=1 Tax=Myroides sp. C4067 TaxID=3136765 RepID=UPI003100CCC3
MVPKTSSPYESPYYKRELQHCRYLISIIIGVDIIPPSQITFIADTVILSKIEEYYTYLMRIYHLIYDLRAIKKTVYISPS